MHVFLAFVNYAGVPALAAALVYVLTIAGLIVAAKKGWL